MRRLVRVRRAGRQGAEHQAETDRTEHDGRDATPRPPELAPGTHADGGAVDVVDIQRIMHAIPHRYPFLLIDRVVDLCRNESAIGIKNVSVNEPFFAGHFPNHPVMPGVLIIESMAQTAAVLVVETLGPEAAGKVVYFMSIEGAKFRRPVVPGDQLRIHVAKERNRGQCLEVQCRGTGGRHVGRRGDLCGDDHGSRSPV